MEKHCHFITSETEIWLKFKTVIKNLDFDWWKNQLNRHVSKTKKETERMKESYMGIRIVAFLFLHCLFYIHHLFFHFIFYIWLIIRQTFTTTLDLYENKIKWKFSKNDTITHYVCIYLNTENAIHNETGWRNHKTKQNKKNISSKIVVIHSRACVLFKDFQREKL